MAESGTLTFLFTDLVASTVLLQELGDDDAQHTFRSVHTLMSDAVVSCHGEELEWLGDGLLAVFHSGADAVRCAIAIQQASRRPISGRKVQIRVGVHAGEALRRQGGYFGTPLVIARRLCDKAEGGQILCSKLIADFLSSRQTFDFHALGSFSLKGITSPVDVCEVVYQRSDPTTLLKRTPFVGRTDQLAELVNKLQQASRGEGAVAMLTGEAGIGKSRLLEEFVALAQGSGAQVLCGSCYDGEWQPPFSPFAEVLVDCCKQIGRDRFQQTAGAAAPILMRIAPALRNSLDDVPELAAVDKDEERFRMLDALAQFFLTLSREQPLVLVLDDLHWADRGTAAILSHVVRFVASSSIFVVGAYRDSEIAPGHPLAAALASITRMPDSKRIKLAGFTNQELGELLQTIGDEPAPDAVVDTIARETDGNPFFVRELLLHLKESGQILTEDAVWNSLTSADEAGIPEGVRALVLGRLARLSEGTNRFLQAAGAFKGVFSFSIAADVAGIDEEDALSAVDEAVAASMLRSAGDDELEFTHAIIRNALYSELSPVRRVRIHRKIAEAMEAHWRERASEHAAEVAYHFWRSSTASGGARGVEYAIAAADNAELSYAYEEVVSFLRIALELLPADDERRGRVLARLGLALVWTVGREDAAKVVREAGEMIARAEGADEAANYYESGAFALVTAGLTRSAWDLAREGLRHINGRRDIVWAGLREIDLRGEEGEDPGNPGIRTDTPGQRQLREVLRSLPREQIRQRDFAPPYESRNEVLADQYATPVSLLFLAGDCQRSLQLFRAAAADAERQGRIARAARAWADAAVCHIGLGEFLAAQAACDRALLLSARAKSLSSEFVNLDLMSARHDFRIALDDGWDEAFQDGTSDLFFQPKPENNWAFAITCSNSAYLAVRTERIDLALQLIGSITNALEQGAPWEPTYSAVACDAGATLWFANHRDSNEVVERNLREKVIAPDFRWPMRDGRLALARLCALRGAFDEAIDWFAKARGVLDEQGAKPLRAITDHDEGLMYLRRGGVGDAQRGGALVSRALEQFEVLGMPGWIRSATKLLTSDQLHSAV